jgi:hypothetical protein
VLSDTCKKEKHGKGGMHEKISIFFPSIFHPAFNHFTQILPGFSLRFCDCFFIFLCGEKDVSRGS